MEPTHHKLNESSKSWVLTTVDSVEFKKHQNLVYKISFINNSLWDKGTISSEIKTIYIRWKKEFQLKLNKLLWAL